MYVGVRGCACICECVCMRVSVSVFVCVCLCMLFLTVCEYPNCWTSRCLEYIIEVYLKAVAETTYMYRWKMEESSAALLLGRRRSGCICLLQVARFLN